MQFSKLSVLLGACAILALPGCQIAKVTGKVAALPFKAVYKTGEFAGKTVYKTGELAGKSVYYTGKGVYGAGKFAGKGVYYIGTTPIKITDKALDTTAKVLSITTQVADAGGKVLTVSRQIQASELEAELMAIRSAGNILSVFVDAIS